MNVVTFVHEHVHQRIANVDIVIHDQDRLLCSIHDGGSRGRSTTKLVPRPGALSRLMVPPCASMTCRAIHSPSPSPPYRFGETARSKRSKIRVWSASEMPIPESR